MPEDLTDTRILSATRNPDGTLTVVFDLPALEWAQTDDEIRERLDLHCGSCCCDSIPAP